MGIFFFFDASSGSNNINQMRKADQIQDQTHEET